MVKEKNKTMLWILIIVLLVIATLTVVAIHFAHPLNKDLSSTLPSPTETLLSEENLTNDNIEERAIEETGIPPEVIQEKLQDVGKLITEEYWFTDVINYSKNKEILKKEWGITESSLLATYAGVICAGVDFSEITVEKDILRRVITVYLPSSEIFSIDIDPESLTIYSEKNGLGNKFTMVDYNSALNDFQNEVKDKAIESGILERAQDNAKTIIRTFANSIIDISDYSVEIQAANK